jgi:hypothetical protein
MKIDKISMWLRGPYFNGNKSNSQKFMRFLKESQGIVDEFLIVLNPLSKKPFCLPAFSDRAILEVASDVASMGFQVGLMNWLTANELCSGETPKANLRLVTLLQKEGIEVSIIDNDLEGSKNDHGWGSNGTIFSDVICERLCEFSKISGNFVVGSKGTRKQDLAFQRSMKKHQGENFSRWQAYSQFNPKKKWTHSDVIRAGVFQDFILSKVDQENSYPDKLSLGLMTAFQNHPKGPKFQDAINLAVSRFENSKIDLREVTIWDSKLTTLDQLVWLRDLKSGISKPRFMTEREEVLFIQGFLARKGYKLKQDGSIGPITKNAISDYSKKIRMTYDETINFILSKNK